MFTTEQFSLFPASYNFVIIVQFKLVIHVVSYILCVCVCVCVCVCIVFHIVYSVFNDMVRSFVPDCNHHVITLLVYNTREFILIFAYYFLFPYFLDSFNIIYSQLLYYQNYSKTLLLLNHISLLLFDHISYINILHVQRISSTALWLSINRREIMVSVVSDGVQFSSHPRLYFRRCG